MNVIFAWSELQHHLTYKDVEQKELTQPSPVATCRRASREMSNFPKLSPVLCHKNKNGFAGFSFLAAAPCESAPSESSIKGAAADPPQPAGLGLSHGHSAQQPAPTAPHIGETKLTILLP